MGFLKVTLDGEEYQYPSNYGLTQCAAHDAFLEPFCAGEDGLPLVDAPDYCGQSWCFVNADTCTNGIIASGYFPDANLSYSYDVCAVAEDEGEDVDGADMEGDEGDDEAEGENEEASADEEEGSDGEEGADGEAEEVEEEETNPFGDIEVFDTLNDFLLNGLPEPEEDCSCLISSGISPIFSPDGDVFIEFEGEGETFQWAPNYGLTECAAHDEENAPFCADEEGTPLVDAPEYCSQQWCYVNAETCTKGVVASSYFEEANLSYSYEVCSDM